MTETITSPYRVAAGEGLANVWWKSGRVTVKAGGAETGHAFSQIETDDPRGSGPPLHLHHNEDETFYVLEGEVTVVVGGERIDLEAGDYLFGPRGTAHAYVVRSERARMLVTASPSGDGGALRQPGRPRHGRRAPDRRGHAADGRAGAPVRRVRLRDPRAAALARRSRVAPPQGAGLGGTAAASFSPRPRSPLLGAAAGVGHSRHRPQTRRPGRPDRLLAPRIRSFSGCDGRRCGGSCVVVHESRPKA